MDKHTSHTPGPECHDCQIEYGHGHDHDDYIDYCPLHAAAPALLQALEEAAIRLDLAAEELANELSGQFSIWAEQARAAIKLARGDA